MAQWRNIFVCRNICAMRCPKAFPLKRLHSPEGVIVATICSSDVDSNLFAAVNLQNDENVIQIDKLSNASELYFFKLLMKADTNIAFGEEFVVLDSRSEPKFVAAG